VAELFLDGERLLLTGKIPSAADAEMVIRYANPLLPQVVARMLRYLPSGTFPAFLASGLFVASISFVASLKRKPGSWALGTGLFLSLVIIAVVNFLGVLDSFYWSLLAIVFIPISIGALIVTRYAASTRA